jgi:sugar lactone lactonase YvrE
MSDIEPRVLLSGLAVGESPRWHEGRLWFAHWGTGEVVAVDPAARSARARVELRVPTTIPISIDWLPGGGPHSDAGSGSLLVVSGRERLLLRQEPDGSLVTHADLGALSPLPWNELVVDGRGNAYVNGGGFDLMAGEPFAPGIIGLVTPDGSVRQVADDIAFPNGMLVTPDNATLIVAESYAKRLTAFDIGPDGGLANRRAWARVDGHPDGICLDADGAVWYADVPNRRCSRVREGGEVLDTASLDRGCFACMLGGPDGRTLFMVAAEWGGTAAMADAPRTGQLLAASAPAPHAGWP